MQPLLPQVTSIRWDRGEITSFRGSLRSLWTLREARFSSRVPGCRNDRFERQLRFPTKAASGSTTSWPFVPFVVNSFLQLFSRLQNH